MGTVTAETLARLPLYSGLTDTDRERLAEIASRRLYERNETVFFEGDPADVFYVIAAGRVKLSKSTPAGRDVILHIFGAGDPLGGVAVYEERPYPASAVAIEETECILIPRAALFGLLERHPSLVRGLLQSLTRRLVELTDRIGELTGGHVEPRFARLFVKLAEEMGRPRPTGRFIPLRLSRQELADLTGTTIETCIRIMSRWGKNGIVETEKDGFLVLDAAALSEMSRD